MMITIMTMMIQMITVMIIDGEYSYDRPNESDGQQDDGNDNVSYGNNDKNEQTIQFTLTIFIKEQVSYLKM